MLKYTIAKYNVDASKVFVTGTSAGAMMTSLMCAVYPEIVTAGSVYSGVAALCPADMLGENASRDCGLGKMHKTATEWASLVRAISPTFDGEFPRMMIWHGTADESVDYANLEEQIKQWTGLLNVSFTRNHTDVPQRDYTKMVFGEQLVAYSAEGVGHTVPVHEEIEMEWFGIAQ